MNVDNLILESINKNDIAALKELYKKGIDINSILKESDYKYHTALTFACDKGNMEIVKYIIDNKADINAINSVGSTPLMTVAANGDYKDCVEILKCLIENGADIEVKGVYTHRDIKYENNALMYAAESGNLQCVNILIKAGANVNSNNFTGLTPLMVALRRRNNYAVAKKLIEKGADVNAKTIHSETVLMFAASSDNTKTIKMLIDKGVDVNATSSAGTALDIAYSSFSIDSYNILKEYQCKK